MTDDSPDWEATARRLLYNELSFNAQGDLEAAMNDVAEDIADGEDLTAEDLNQLARPFYETLEFINEFLVPLVDDPDKIRWEFALEAEDWDEIPDGSEPNED